jgi:hypothetical protein
MSNSEPRLTQKFEFRWNLNPNTIQITKNVGQARMASWVGINKASGPWVEHGPINTHEVDPAQLEIRGSNLSLVNTGHRKGSYSLGELGYCLFPH